MEADGGSGWLKDGLEIMGVCGEIYVMRTRQNGRFVVFCPVDGLNEVFSVCRVRSNGFYWWGG